MNRLLQRFVGDAQQTQQLAGEADWAAARAHETQQPAGTAYSHQQLHQQQQQLYASQQQSAAANSLGLEEIPLSSPVGARAGAFFDSQTHFGRPPPPNPLKQRQEAAADVFFQSEGVSPPPRPGSADVFAQPPRSGTSSHSSAFGGGFFESAADPFASAPTSSRSAFDAPRQQQPVLSTSKSVSDLFVSPPHSTTPSFDRFEHQQHESTSLSASSSSAELFANPPQTQAASSFYDGFAHQQQSDSAWATADDLFASAEPSSVSFHSSGSGSEQQSPFASAPGSFHSSGGVEQQAREVATPPAPAVTPPTAAASTDTGNSAATDLFANSTTTAFPSSGFDQQLFESDSASPSADPFASSSSGMVPSASHTFEQQATPADPFAAANYSVEHHEQQQQQQEHDYYQQQHYDYQQQQQSYDQQQQQQVYDQYQQYDYYHQQQQYDQSQHYDQQHQHYYDQQHQHYDQQQYDQQYHFTNQEGTASLFEATASSSNEQTNPFAAQAEAIGLSTDAHADPFAQHSGHSHSGHGDANATAATTDVFAAPSPTQVTDFFSEAPPTPSASSLFDSQPSERSFDGASKPPTPVRQPSPVKAAQTSSVVGFSSAEAHRELFSEPQTVSTTPTASRRHNQMNIKELSPVADDDDADDDADDEGVEAVARSLKQTTLDDSVKLVEMYKHMTERLEGEKNELLKVLADQADQFYQMQEYIASLERELAAHRSTSQ